MNFLRSKLCRSILTFFYRFVSQTTHTGDRALTGPRTTYPTVFLSTGITIINVAANPLTTLLGDPQGAHVRINFVQSFSRIGYAATPVIAAALIYNRGGEIKFYFPYMLIGLAILTIAILIYFSRMPSLQAPEEEKFSFRGVLKKSRKYPHLLYGVVAMFFYVGAEASTAGFFIPYLTANWDLK